MPGIRGKAPPISRLAQTAHHDAVTIVIELARRTPLQLTENVTAIAL